MPNLNNPFIISVIAAIMIGMVTEIVVFIKVVKLFRRSKKKRDSFLNNGFFEESEDMEKEGEKKDTVGRSEEQESEREVVVSIREVSMCFNRAKEERGSLKEYLICMLKRQNKYEKFVALDHISLDIFKGEVIGIIGTNGSGKSTLLKIISGVLSPTEGQVIADQKKIQLLTLGTGFDFELTGKENVYLNGAIIGYSKKYIDEKYDSIVKFSELEGFMEDKVKNFSSGMVSRLAFAIATMRDTPEILILDEVLSVGDMFFRIKSEQRIQEMIHSGSTVLIVSHSMETIKKNCSRAVWIDKGRILAMGDPQQVCAKYVQKNSQG